MRPRRSSRIPFPCRRPRRGCPRSGYRRWGRCAHLRRRRTLCSHARASCRPRRPAPVAGIHHRTRGVRARTGCGQGRRGRAGQMAVLQRPSTSSVHVVEIDGEVVGMSIWFLNFSTWEGNMVLTWRISTSARPPVRQGAGRAPATSAGGGLDDNGYARLELSVLDWNLPAIGFYRTLGAVGMDDWTVQRASPARHCAHWPGA